MGEWIVANIFNIITLVTIFCGGIIAFVRLQKDVEVVKQDGDENKALINKVKIEVQSHITDDERHVNTLYMKTLKEDIESIKTEQKEFRASVDKKLDKLTEKIYSK